MLISFDCPHCGTHSDVPEKDAGKSGPCKVCGKQVTIPGSPFSPIKKKGSPWGAILAVVAVVLLIGCGILVAVVVPTILAARAAARNFISQNNLTEIAHAVEIYRTRHGHYPPAYVADQDGKPLYSWRVLILPYLDQQALYDAFDKDQAWDSPKNKVYSDMTVAYFQSPDAQSAGTSYTDYVAVVGDETVFVSPPKEPATRIEDGMATTIIAVEIGKSNIHWAEPKDLSLDEMNLQVNDPAGNCISGSAGRDTANVVFADMRPGKLSASTDPKTVRALLTRNGKERINREALNLNP